jgi:hypothetical protein
MFLSLLFCHLQITLHNACRLSILIYLVRAFYSFPNILHTSFHQAKRTCPCPIFHYSWTSLCRYFHQQMSNSHPRASSHLDSGLHTWHHLATFQLLFRAAYLQTTHLRKLLH